MDVGEYEYSSLAMIATGCVMAFIHWQCNDGSVNS